MKFELKLTNKVENTTTTKEFETFTGVVKALHTAVSELCRRENCLADIHKGAGNLLRKANLFGSSYGNLVYTIVAQRIA